MSPGGQRRGRPGGARRSGRAGALDSQPVRPPGPVRTCVGCRERVARADLLRVVAVEGRLVPDPARRLPGRGASVHPDPHCIDLADTRRAFPRALRLPGPLDASAVRAAVRDAGPPA
ncbi:MAG TPA: YlxR family protein [Mycobacteriales bacterium]|nr:YlxR family protein [Mycobacteriales bacterium]